MGNVRLDDFSTDDGPLILISPPLNNPLLVVHPDGSITGPKVQEIILAERERCAKIAEGNPGECQTGCETGAVIAAKIRGGGAKPTGLALKVGDTVEIRKPGRFIVRGGELYYDQPASEITTIESEEALERLKSMAPWEDPRG